ncbi:MAG: ERF family protein [Gammaproteobacteria bacterium]|nr:ERF family protein [Gammaproteobacteria bacterium]
MGDIKRVPKSGFNSHHRYEYATDADVSDLIRPVMAAHGVALVPIMESIVSHQPHGKQNRMLVQWTMRLMCGPGEHERVDVKWFSESLDAQDKAIAKAATSAVKYFLLKTFVVSTGDIADETDAAAGSDAHVTQPQTAHVSDAQLHVMRQIVSEAGGTWEKFSEWVMGRSGVFPESLTADAAGMYIAKLQQRAAEATVEAKMQEAEPMPEYEPPAETSAPAEKPTDSQRTRDRIRR